MSLNPIGLVLPAAAIGLSALLIRPQRGFFNAKGADGAALGPIVAQVVIEERHHDELQITEHPVEQGASIADHAFKMPAEVVIRCGWSNSPSASSGLIGRAVGLGAALGGKPVGVLAAIPGTVAAAQSLFKGNDQSQVKRLYQQLLQLQESRSLFDVLTGKRQYTNMLLKSLSVDTDRDSENILMVVATCRQVIIVATQVVSVSNDPEVQQNPEKTTPIQNQGSQQLKTGDSFSFGSDSGALSLSGSLNALGAGISTTLESLVPQGELLGQLSGPISQVTDVLVTAKDSIASCIGQLPLPFEIPTIANPQELITSLTGIDMKSSGLTDSLTSLEGVLQQTQTAVIGTIQQVPSIQASLPPSLSGLKPALLGVEALMHGTFKELGRVLQ